MSQGLLLLVIFLILVLLALVFTPVKPNEEAQMNLLKRRIRFQRHFIDAIEAMKWHPNFDGVLENLNNYTLEELRSVADETEKEFDNIFHDPYCILNKGVFNKLARPRTIINRETKPTKLDVVVAYYKCDITWLYNILERMDRESYRLFVYSKGDMEVPEQYKHLIDQWIELENIGRCDHSYVYHLLNTPDRSSKTFLVKDAALRHMSENWLEQNLHHEGVVGPILRKAHPGISNFTMPIYEKSHDQNKGDPYVKAPKSMSNLREWCNYVFGLRVRKHNGLLECTQRSVADMLSIINYGGILLFDDVNIPDEILIKAGLTMSYASNVETGHFMERVWRYVLSGNT